MAAVWIDLAALPSLFFLLLSRDEKAHISSSTSQNSACTNCFSSPHFCSSSLLFSPTPWISCAEGCWKNEASENQTLISCCFIRQRKRLRSLSPPLHAPSLPYHQMVMWLPLLIYVQLSLLPKAWRPGIVGTLQVDECWSAEQWRSLVFFLNNRVKRTSFGWIFTFNCLIELDIWEQGVLLTADIPRSIRTQFYERSHQRWKNHSFT